MKRSDWKVTINVEQQEVNRVDSVPSDTPEKSSSENGRVIKKLLRLPVKRRPQAAREL